MTPEPDAAAEVRRPLSIEGLARSIRYHLAHHLEYRQTGSNPKFNGYAYAEVPEWQLRQWQGAAEHLTTGGDDVG